ncbi:PQQ-binding-like beta-propeller repeat protein [Streptomyces sp. NPDC051963]|uniref:outer membrane protein assembly factor BamB family protein n=1 Tax=Streptomyces sp. NPDC051963 TaxID=3365678 RepID=UPI0037CEB3AA
MDASAGRRQPERRIPRRAFLHGAAVLGGVGGGLLWRERSDAPETPDDPKILEPPPSSPSPSGTAAPPRTRSWPIPRPVNHEAVVHVGTSLFITQVGGNIWAYDARTGAEKWRFRPTGLGTRWAGDPHAGAFDTVQQDPPVTAGKLLFTSLYWRTDEASPQDGPDAGVVMALDADTGREVWRRKVGHPADLAVGGDLLLIKPRPGGLGTQTDVLHAVELETGAEVWEFSHPTHDIQSFLPHRDAVVVSRMGGALATGLRPGTGRAMWHRDARDGLSGTPFQISGEVALFFGWSIGDPNDPGSSTAVHVSCAVAATGRILWQRDLPRSSQDKPFVHEGIVILHADGQVIALDLTSGVTKWTYQLPAYGYPVALRVADGLVLTRDTSDDPLISEINTGTGKDPSHSRIVALATGSGKKQWDLEVPGWPLEAIAVKDGIAVLLSTELSLRAVDIRRGRKLWEKSGAESAEVDGEFVRIEGEELDLVHLCTGATVRG